MLRCSETPELPVVPEPARRPWAHSQFQNRTKPRGPHNAFDSDGLGALGTRACPFPLSFQLPFPLASEEASPFAFPLACCSRRLRRRP